MPVYVDDMMATYGDMTMCHLIATSTADLLAMVDLIGVNRRWIQHAGTPKEHFDIAKTKRAAAIAAGAVPITRRQYAGMIRRRSQTGSLGSPDDAVQFLVNTLRNRRALVPTSAPTHLQATMQLDLLHRPSGRTAMLMASGFTFDLNAPDATGMPITDIARALAYQPRWAGATRQFYSVAEHSVMVSRLVPSERALDGLLHDCEEAICADLPSVVKVLMGRDHLKARFAPIKTALSNRFGFRLDDPIVKQADLVCMATELRDLLPPAWMDWGHLPSPHPDPIIPIGPERAYDLFLSRYHEIQHLARHPSGTASQKATAR